MDKVESITARRLVAQYLITLAELEDKMEVLLAFLIDFGGSLDMLGWQDEFITCAVNQSLQEEISRHWRDVSPTLFVLGAKGPDCRVPTNLGNVRNIPLRKSIVKHEEQVFVEGSELSVRALREIKQECFNERFQCGNLRMHLWHKLDIARGLERCHFRANGIKKLHSSEIDIIARIVANTNEAVFRW